MQADWAADTCSLVSSSTSQISRRKDVLGQGELLPGTGQGKLEPALQDQPRWEACSKALACSVLVLKFVGLGLTW